MNIAEIRSKIKYLTNSEGEETEVVIPIELWQTLLELGELLKAEEKSVGFYSVDAGKKKRQTLLEIVEMLKTEYNSSVLHLIDEKEPKEQILADLQEAVRSVKAGLTYPVSQLWDDCDT